MRRFNRVSSISRRTGPRSRSRGAAAQPLDLYRHTYWIEVRCDRSRRPPRRCSSFGGVPRRALGRLVTEGPAVSLVAVDYRGLLRTPDRASEMLLMSRDEQSQLVGAGWSRSPPMRGGGFRWMTAPRRACCCRSRAQARGGSASRPCARPTARRRSGWRSTARRCHGSRCSAAGRRTSGICPKGWCRQGPLEAAVIVDALPASADDEAPRAVAIADIRLIAR